jgi:predicted Zn-dependent protease
MSLDPKSRDYDPTYKPTKSLEQLVKENPKNQFLADRLAELKAAQEKRSRR